ncbi:MAG TPA: MATE family efflux transporter [Planctomycetota bacterium]
MYRRLISGGGTLFGIRVGGALLTYATQVLLAQWIGGSELGSFVEVFAWCLILSTVSMLGLGTAAMRFISGYMVAQRFGAIRGYITSSRWIVTIVSVVLAAIAGAIAIGFGFVDSDSARNTLLLGLACSPGMAWLRLHSGVAHAMSWSVLAFFPNIFLRPLLLLGAVALAHATGWLSSSGDAMGLQLAVIAIAVVAQDALLVPRIRRVVPLATPERENPVWVKTGAPLIFVTLFTQYFPEISVVALGAFLPDADVAVFNAGIRTSMFIGFGLTAIDTLTLPTVTRLYAGGERAKMQSVLVHATRLKFVAALFAVGFMFVAGKPILGLFGAEFVDGHYALIVLTIAQVVRAAIGPVGEILSVTGHQNQCLLVYAVSFAALIGLNAVLLGSFGVLGGAFAVLAVTAFSSLWLHWLLVRGPGVRPSIFGRVPAQ